MTKISHILETKIIEQGPITLFDYMNTALAHPEYGYYQKADPFGERGDFVTAPEISQMFGELIGLWCVDCWVKLGTPAKFHLMELGPGQGTLMSDALRSAALAPDFLNSVQIHMVETSDRLTHIQQKKMAAFDVQWHSEIPDFDENPILVIANEFFDALPIHQFERSEGHWFERLVTLADHAFSLKLSSTPTDPALYDLPSSSSAEDGNIAEVNPIARSVTHSLATLLQRNGGAALCIDYGPTQSAFGDSFQAVQDHKYVDVLQDPGSADLTAHVDFEVLAKIAQKCGCTTLPVSTQGRFLERLGIEARVWQLSKDATPVQKEKIANDMKRLVSTQEMGTLFKTFSFYHHMQEPPSGFGE